MDKTEYTITKKDLSDYKEIRGTIKKKTHIFGKYYFVISDGEKDVKINAGKGLYDMPMYGVGAELTVGYSGKKLINIRPGIVENED